MKLTKQELDQLAQMLRQPAANHEAVLWAVSYHVPLFLWGIQSAAKTIEALVLAANQGRADNIVERIGVDRLEQFRGECLIDTSYRGFVERDLAPAADES
jgi:hypothetical protein